VLPDVRLHPRPRFVPVDVGINLKALIPALTAAGFDPSLKCLVVMEGVLPHLQPVSSPACAAYLPWWGTPAWVAPPLGRGGTLAGGSWH
jgi:hypothetical protein